MYILEDIILIHINKFNENIINIELMFKFVDNNLKWNIKAIFYLLDCKNNYIECLINKCYEYLDKKRENLSYNNLKDIITTKFGDLCKSSIHPL